MNNLLEYNYLILFFGLISLVLSLVVTPFVIRLANLRGWIVAPRKDRWHSTPTALMGGISIFFAFLISVIVSSIFLQINWIVIVAFTIMFLTGLIDDLKEQKPIFKLVAQVLATFLLINQGFIFGNGQLGWFGVPVTFLWVIGITNAINLLDNMDGLSAGVSSIVAIITGILSLQSGHDFTALLSFIIAGSTLGFLRYNFNPAKIFMGDSGSLFLGFSLSFLALSVQKNMGSASVYIILVLPMAIMAMPILDTSLVTFKRLISGRKVYMGGRDHSSHRLVALGLSEKKAVLLLYGIALVWGLSAIFLINSNKSSLYLPVIAVLLIFTSFFALFLGNVKVYNESEEKLAYLRSRGQYVEKGGVLFRFLLMNKKIILGVSFDILVISVSFYISLLTTATDLSSIYSILALIILVKVMFYFIFKSYRKSWRYISVSDLNSYFLSGFLGSILVSFIISFVYTGIKIQFLFYAIDFLLTFFGCILVRVIFKYIRETILRYRTYDQKVLIYGAGELGNLLSRQLFLSEKLKLKPVGFIDDDKSMTGSIINGVEVMGDLTEIENICKQLNVNSLIAASYEIKDEILVQLKERLSPMHINVMRFEMRVNDIK
jgi:UDP-GlcNAc:undecaprenyl-phosphate GlcNAc-1-phosphate transferase